MDADDQHAFDLFLEVYGTLPRAAPGGSEHTERAIAALPGSAPRTVLDLGCGPGAHTLTLARAFPDAQVLAIDVLPAMVEEAGRRIDEAGLGHRVEAQVADMASPPVTPRSQDLIWTEGAIYNVGVTEALRLWEPLLAPGGTVAFTEPVWIVDSPPAEARDWWEAEYPAITDDSGVRAHIDAASFRTLTSFPLPASAWWEDYYEPMQDRIGTLEARLPDDLTARDVVAMARKEIEMFRRFSDAYTYAFYIVQPTDGT